jgi:hypothetical protein
MQAGLKKIQKVKSDKIKKSMQTGQPAKKAKTGHGPPKQ